MLLWLQELSQQYDDEIDQHQRELSALQDVHAQKIATIKRKNKDEVSQLHEQLSDLQDQVADLQGQLDDQAGQFIIVRHVFKGHSDERTPFIQ